MSPKGIGREGKGRGGREEFPAQVPWGGQGVGWRGGGTWTVLRHRGSVQGSVKDPGTAEKGKVEKPEYTGK